MSGKNKVSIGYRTKVKNHGKKSVHFQDPEDFKKISAKSKSITKQKNAIQKALLNQESFAMNGLALSDKNSKRH